MRSTFRGEKTFSRQPAFPGKVDTRIADAAQFEQMNGEKKPSAPYPSRAVFFILGNWVFEWAAHFTIKAAGGFSPNCFTFPTWGKAS